MVTKPVSNSIPLPEYYPAYAASSPCDGSPGSKSTGTNPPVGFEFRIAMPSSDCQYNACGSLHPSNVF